MIPRQEVLDLAADFGLTANVVEKDYALGWLLAAFGEHPDTRETWLFKGGTCQGIGEYDFVPLVPVPSRAM